MGVSTEPQRYRKKSKECRRNQPLWIWKNIRHFIVFDTQISFQILRICQAPGIAPTEQVEYLNFIVVVNYLNRDYSLLNCIICVYKAIVNIPI